ncbi:MAG TPA: YeeE/YedE family protein [Clostridiales bacterium]|nr:YeeE/YedE family protein [Clostridiales bacterium]
MTIKGLNIKKYHHVKGEVAMHNWKWLKGALMLGVVFFIAALLVKPIGVSTQFSVASGILHSALDPDVIQIDETRDSGYRSSNAYYDKSDGKLAKSIKNPINYDFIFVLAIPLGALAGYLFNKSKKRNTIEAQQLDSEFDAPEFTIKAKQSTARPSFLKNYLPAFVGGFLLLFGARMADGCTSGHMFSGIMQGSVSGFIFAAAVFLTGIPAARHLNKYVMEREVG